MNTLILAAIRCSLLFLVPSVTYAISTQWDLDPISGDWNTAANWTPMGVPNGPADTATFGLSNTTDVSISGNTEVNGITFTSAATNPYTITPSPGFTLTISGVGITNKSGITQNFVTALDGAGNRGQIVFANNATAANGVFTNNNGSTSFSGNSTAANGVFINNSGFTSFSGNSTAANGTFINNGGSTRFSGNSTAANGTFINNFGSTSLSGNSTAANGTFINNNDGITEVSNAANGTFINNGGTASALQGFTEVGGNTAANGRFINNGGTASGAGGGVTELENSTAANGTFINNGGTASGAGGGFTQFSFGATAANAIFTNNGATVSGAQGGFTRFTRTSSAGNATLIANGGSNGGGGGAIFFEGRFGGGTERVEVFGNGSLDISAHVAHTGGVPIGSIEGDGTAFLGANNLKVGSNNLSTIFSGVIQDGGIGGGTGGSMTKFGSGTLILSGASTYTGNTDVRGGVLKVDGSITSNTFVRHHSILAGTGTINGNVTNFGRVSPGDSPGVLTVVDNYTQTHFGTLMMQIAGMSPGQFSVLDVMGTANLSGQLDPVLLNGFIPTIGQSFTFLNYGAVNGTLSIFNANIDNLPEHWVIGYEPTFAMLTVAPGNVHVPDQGSTFLLLTLGFLGLVTFRRPSLRAQS